MCTFLQVLPELNGRAEATRLPSKGCLVLLWTVKAHCRRLWVAQNWMAYHDSMSIGAASLEDTTLGS